MRRAIAAALALTLAAALAEGTAAARQAPPNRVSRSAVTRWSVPLAHRGGATSLLIYGPSIAAKADVNEMTVAGDLGFHVTKASKAEWSAMSETDFAAYDAIVFGDPNCKGDTRRLATAVANRAVWSAAIHGSVVVAGTDPVWHANHGGPPGTVQLIADTLTYVSAGGPTGLAVSLSCYYAGARPGKPVRLLRDLGAFTVQGQGRPPLPGCPNKIETPNPSDPFLVDLTAEDLSDWGCSIHEAFDGFPYGYRVIAQHKKSDLPYIIAGHRS
jgi:hypothetical protein